MGVSFDYFPHGVFKMKARAQPVSGHPVRIEFHDDGDNLICDISIFTRSAAIAVRLERAINAAMTNPQGDGREVASVIKEFVERGQKAQDAIEELIGPHDQDAGVPIDTHIRDAASS